MRSYAYAGDALGSCYVLARGFRELLRALGATHLQLRFGTPQQWLSYTTCCLRSGIVDPERKSTCNEDPGIEPVLHCTPGKFRMLQSAYLLGQFTRQLFICCFVRVIDQGFQRAQRHAEIRRSHIAHSGLDDDVPGRIRKHRVELHRQHHLTKMHREVPGGQALVRQLSCKTDLRHDRGLRLTERRRNRVEVKSIDEQMPADRFTIIVSIPVISIGRNPEGTHAETGYRCSRGSEPVDEVIVATLEDDRLACESVSGDETQVVLRLQPILVDYVSQPGLEVNDPGPGVLDEVVHPGRLVKGPREEEIARVGHADAFRPEVPAGITEALAEEDFLQLFRVVSVGDERRDERAN